MVTVVMAHNPAHDLFSFGNFLCPEGCGLLRYLIKERYDSDSLLLWFGVISAFWSRSWRALIQLFIDMGLITRVFNMKRRTYSYLLPVVDFYDAFQFEMINFANVKIEHFNSDPVISLFWNMQITCIYGKWHHLHKLNICKPYRCYNN